jgi:hypothetical protein
VRDRAELVVVVLEQVRVDRADLQPARLDVLAQRAVVVDLVPREVQRDRAGGAGQALDLGGVVDPLEDIARAAGLGERPEARAGIAVAPRRGLDHELAQAGLDVGHDALSSTWRPVTARKRS